MQKAGVLIKYLRLDRAGEHVAKRFRKFLDRKGIVTSYTATNSSAGPAEAYIHICQDAMVSMLEHYHEMHGKRASDKREYAFRYACDTKSMTWCTTNDGESMYEKQTGKAPPLDKCHAWGVTVTAHQSDKTQRLKGANRGRKGEFMGFASDGDGYTVWDPVKRTMFNAKFVLAADLAKHKQVDPEEAEVLDAATEDIKGRRRTRAERKRRSKYSEELRKHRKKKRWKERSGNGKNRSAWSTTTKNGKVEKSGWHWAQPKEQQSR